MKRILIPYYSAGYGHYSFAKALSHYFKIHAPNWEIRLFDIVKELDAKNLDELYVQSWKKILASSNWVKKFSFRLGILFYPITNAVLQWHEKINLEKFHTFVEAWKPDAVLATHWGGGRLVHAYKKHYKRQDLSLSYIFTELAGKFPPINCGADWYYAMSEQAEKDLRSLGVDKDIITRIGLVVQPNLQAILASEESTRPEFIKACRQEMGLRPDAFTVVFSLGGEGLGKATKFLQQFYDRNSSAQLLVLTGNNIALAEWIKKTLSPRAGKSLIQAFSYLPDLNKPFIIADAFAGKCGTSFAMETIMLGKPLLVTHLGAPNEGMNKDYLLAHGYGKYLPKPKAFCDFIDLLAEEGPDLQAFKSSFSVSLPGNGAEDVVVNFISRLS